MSSAQKQKIEEWATWITRGLVVFLLTTVYNKIDKLEAQVTQNTIENQVLKVEVSQLQDRMKDFNSVIREYQLIRK